MSIIQHPILKSFAARALFLPTYAWNVLLGRVLKHRRWWDYVDDGVILGARPLTRDLANLYREGVRAVINMCQEYPGPVDAYKKLGIEQLWLPTIDFQPPSLKHVSQGVDFIQQVVDRGDKVYVHCKAGRARSATVVLCWLVKHRKMSVVEAQTHLLLKRPHVHARLTERSVVKEYAKQLAEAEAAEASTSQPKSS
jgi:atypical dual specificity phosphatase